MKNLFSFHALLTCSFFALLSFTIGCSSEELVQPTSSDSIETQLSARTDFSGLEVQVKQKIAVRENISISTITSCYYHGQTSEGYGLYKYTTSHPTTGSFLVTGIIGDEVEGL